MDTTSIVDKASDISLRTAGVFYMEYSKKISQTIKDRIMLMNMAFSTNEIRTTETS